MEIVDDTESCNKETHSPLGSCCAKIILNVLEWVMNEQHQGRFLNGHSFSHPFERVAAMCKNRGRRLGRNNLIRCWSTPTISLRLTKHYWRMRSSQTSVGSLRRWTLKTSSFFVKISFLRKCSFMLIYKLYV